MVGEEKEITVELLDKTMSYILKLIEDGTIENKNDFDRGFMLGQVSAWKSMKDYLLDRDEDLEALGNEMKEIINDTLKKENRKIV